MLNLEAKLVICFIPTATTGVGSHEDIHHVPSCQWTLVSEIRQLILKC